MLHQGCKPTATKSNTDDPCNEPCSSTTTLLDSGKAFEDTNKCDLERLEEHVLFSEKDKVDNYYYPSMSYSALLSTRSPDRYGLYNLRSPNRPISSIGSPDFQYGSGNHSPVCSKVAVELLGSDNARYDTDMSQSDGDVGKDNSYQITSWENKWFDHAALVGRFMAEDLVTQDMLSTDCAMDAHNNRSNKECSDQSSRATPHKLTRLQNAQESTSHLPNKVVDKACLFCEPIDWTEIPATNVLDGQTQIMDSMEDLVEEHTNNNLTTVERDCIIDVTKVDLQNHDTSDIPKSASNAADSTTLDSTKECSDDGDKINDECTAANTSQIYRCTFNGCEAQFSKAPVRWYHYRSEHSTYRFECEYCKKKFIKKQHLDIHIRTHLKIKDYQCMHAGCGASFLTAQHLRNHNKIHTGEKPFECSECGKSFREKSTLKKHVLTHSHVKRYKCEDCDKWFAQSSSRTQHRKRFHNLEHYTNSSKVKDTTKSLAISDNSTNSTSASVNSKEMEIVEIVDFCEIDDCLKHS
uniref:Zf-H2C2_2 domain-containing protein n=1 Tax=Charistephane fugiens TaxID=140462 RepID=V9PPN4_9METZ|nr:zf-H2C2_2 domain-containing protein [Charistephane fugiens]AHA51302.1 zf-H2C2_2 domain-containing protein [Charistephane fugiens]